jgi:prevent-host-death family protein
MPEGKTMKNVGLFEAKQKLSELVERAEEGERIGITRRGKLAAILVPAGTESNVQTVFEKIEEIRKRARRRKGVTARTLIEEGRI